MARRTKSAPARPTPKGGGVRPTGRVTPKGGDKAAAKPGQSVPTPSGRYTPPIPREYRESPKWVLALLLTFLLAGMLTILSNYLGLLPGGAKNVYLLVGLGLITCGFVTATRYR